MLARSVYNETKFRHQVDSALAKVKTILDTTRTPSYAADADHTYDDKYGLAEFLSNAAMAAQINALERLGMGNDTLKKLHDLVVGGKRSVTLRLAANETCEFLKEEEVTLESKHQFITETETVESAGGEEGNEKKTTSTSRQKVMTTFTKYHWKLGINYELFAFAGNDPEKTNTKVILQSRQASHNIVTTDKRSLFPSVEYMDPVDLDLTWLMQNISEESFRCNFKIQRLAESCRTPSRNEEISAAIAFFNSLEEWSGEIEGYFHHVSQKIYPLVDQKPPESQVDVNSIHARDVFVPVLPLFENPNKANSDNTAMSELAESNETQPSTHKHSNNMLVSLPDRDDKESKSSPLLSIADVNLFLNEQCRSLDLALHKISTTFPSKDAQKLISTAEASLVLLSQHMSNISRHFCDGVVYIEEMLRSQLVSAIGREVQAKDFQDFIHFNNKKLFKSEFVPKPFCHAIRRPEHYPDGVLSIESEQSESATPVTTFLRKIEDSSTPMLFPINAATSVEFTGERFLHAWVCHQFGQNRRTNSNFKLVARARQFSSFLLLIGNVSGPNSFEPKHAIILQNKDEVLIPLLLNQLPTPKEFKDAIQSLSPEQQRFAKAFRSMQLESSVFGVCAVQLKPQLEVLLGLPHDSLTKEIRLTQDLLSLFIDYQISSDLLSFDGDASMSVSEKVGVVKGHVAAVQGMIEEMKKKDLREAEEEADMDFELRSMAVTNDIYNEGGRGGDRYGGRDGGRYGGRDGGRYGYEDVRRAGGHGDRSCGRREKCRLSRSSAPPASAPRPSPQASVQMYSQPVPVMKARESRPSNAAPKDTFQAAKQDEKQTTSPKHSHIIKNTTDSYTRDAKETKHVDFTLIPKQLDAKFEELDEDSSLRPTVIKTADVWSKNSQQNLLTKMTEKNLYALDQKNEKNKAFDLLDALSRSGSLPIACAELHVFVAATHVFEHSLIDTVIQDNVNPIEKMEKSMVIVASTIFGVSPAELLKSKVEESRMLMFSPTLFNEHNNDREEETEVQMIE